MLLAIDSYLVVVALLCGSFISLAADRLPRGESIVRPRSHCRACDRQLNTVDLLPIAGYLIRRGRCATCRTPIGVSSPLTEAAAGTCMLLALAWLGLWPGAAAGFVLVGLLGLVSVGLSVVRSQGAAAASGR
jgi:prepilin signal peptidase PulO-like enzyme (type II secretory pathway)